MNVRDLVASFYGEIWNRGDLSLVPALLAADFTFRGSLGVQRKGHAGFASYVAMVRGALADYHCDVLDLVSEGGRAFARMRFSGVHVAEFLGYAPTGRRVEWDGAALFTTGPDGRISDLWVLGDTQALSAQLEANAKGTRS
jgi:steroid delta-isomerase-like uncharacterized protein